MYHLHPNIGGPAKAFLSRSQQLLIGGRRVDAKSGKTFEVRDPATGRVIAQVAEGDAADIDAAVRAARDAFEGSWSRTSPHARARLLWNLADLIETNIDELAELESLNNGKPVMAARHAEIPAACQVLRDTAGWATKITGDTLTLSDPGETHAFTMREPVGVAGQIIPWNAPLLMAAWKLAPALTTGCTVVLKPAEETPLTALRLGELIQEAGFPDGVVNIVPGFGPTAGAALAAHAGVDKVAFTGSSEVGRMVLNAAAGNLKKVSLELGGKSPIIVFPDADLDRVVPGVARSAFYNSGQVCGAGTRLYAHKRVFDVVLEGIAAEAAKLRVGHGLDEDTQMGPVISERQMDRVTGYIDDGAKAGAKIVTGGCRLGDEGYFVAPTILADTTAEMSVVREEIFGPVLCTMSFDDDDLDAVARQANDSIYGLAASVWTRDLGTAHRMVRRIKAGTIGVNTGGSIDPAVPFGGYKQSGWGREKGREVLELYTEVKSVVMAL